MTKRDQRHIVAGSLFGAAVFAMFWFARKTKTIPTLQPTQIKWTTI